MPCLLQLGALVLFVMAFAAYSGPNGDVAEAIFYVLAGAAALLAGRLPIAGQSGNR